MLALLGVLLTVVFISGCTQVPEEKPAEGQTKATSLNNPGQSLTSVLSEYQGMDVLLFIPLEQRELLRGTLKEVNANYIIVESTKREKRDIEIAETAITVIPISHIAGITKFDQPTFIYIYIS